MNNNLEANNNLLDINIFLCVCIEDVYENIYINSFRISVDIETLCPNNYFRLELML